MVSFIKQSVKEYVLDFTKQFKYNHLFSLTKESVVREEVNYAQKRFTQQAKQFLMRPILIEKYFQNWMQFSVYSTLFLIITLPFQLLKFICLKKIQHTNIFALLVCVSVYVFTTYHNIFDISFLYHSFRAQTTLKFYGLLFAFQVSQKLLTMFGRPVLQSLIRRIQYEYSLDGSSSIFSCYKQILGCLLYILLHTYSIYLEFTVFIVVINSEIEAFIIYFFVMNLTKMKSTAFKKFDEASYKAQINYDMKDRMQKIIYIVLFKISQSNRNVDGYYFKLMFVFLMGTLIQWIKHTTVISLTEKKGDSSKIADVNKKALTQKLILFNSQLKIESERSLKVMDSPTLKSKGSEKFIVQKPKVLKSNDKLIDLQKLSSEYLPNIIKSKDLSVVEKCIKIDYNILPLVTFILKMCHTIMSTQSAKIQFQNIWGTLLMIFLYFEMATVGGVLYQFYKLFQQQDDQELQQ